jgi:hypothetical protein
MSNATDVRIGTQAGETGGMVPMKVLKIPAPFMDFLEFSVETELGDGTIDGNGWPEAEWHWGFLTKTQYDALAAYKTGKSTSVYIRSLKDGGAYATFLATMIWPARERWESNCVIDFTVRFIAMVEQV